MIREIILQKVVQGLFTNIMKRLLFIVNLQLIYEKSLLQIRKTNLFVLNHIVMYVSKLTF